jgi:hypothetical protein
MRLVRHADGRSSRGARTPSRRARSDRSTEASEPRGSAHGPLGPLDRCDERICGPEVTNTRRVHRDAYPHVAQQPDAMHRTYRSRRRRPGTPPGWRRQAAGRRGAPPCRHRRCFACRPDVVARPNRGAKPLSIPRVRATTHHALATTGLTDCRRRASQAPGPGGHATGAVGGFRLARRAVRARGVSVRRLDRRRRAGSRR